MTADEVTTLVREQLVDSGVEPEDVEEDASLTDLGMDSLDAQNLVRAITKKFGVELDHEQVAGLTVDGLVEEVLTRGDAPRD